MAKQEDRGRKRSKAVPKQGKRKEMVEGTLINRKKLTKLLYGLEKYRQENKLVPVEWEFLLTKNLEIIKQCDKETFAVAKEVERRKMISEIIKNDQETEEKKTNGNGGTANYVT